MTINQIIATLYCVKVAVIILITNQTIATLYCVKVVVPIFVTTTHP